MIADATVKVSATTSSKNDYGLCPACDRPKTSSNWCPPCHAKLLLEEHQGRTSGDKDLDDFIKKTIIDARRSFDYIEWIPFENFKDIKEIGKGGFATAYSAIRTNCLKGHFEWNNKDKKYFRESWKDYPIALKFFHNTPDIAATFLNEIKVHHKCMMQQGNGFLQCYGVSRHPVTMEFITVLDFAQHGDFRNFLRQNHKTLKWEDKLSFATKIADDLKIIHDSDFVHGDFHSGNVLQVSTTPSVSDFGLSHEDKDYVPEGGVFGVVPYMAPELFQGKPYRKPADVYSYGTIMWEISSGRPAFCGKSHDHSLILQICEGTRPQIVTGTPPCYVELMQRCWDKEPARRPTATELYDTCLKWYNCVKERKVESDIYQQFIKADEMIKTNNGVIPTDNPKAIYSSRYIPFTKQHDNTMQHDTIQHDFATDDLTMCYGFDIDG